MKAAKMVILAGITGTLASMSVFAVPLNITLQGGAPFFNWGEALNADPGFADSISIANQSQVNSVNLAGVNSINLTWQAPAGYMYVVNPPPAGLFGNSATLWFEAQYESAGPASSLGSITSSSFSAHTVYGSLPFGGGVTMGNGPGGTVSLDFAAIGGLNPSSAPFAFTSMSISAAFSGTGADTTLDKTANSEQASFFGIYYGDFARNGPGATDYYIPPYPGPLITMEPLPSGSVPDVSSTLTMAGLGFGGLLLMGRKRLPVVS